MQRFFSFFLCPFRLLYVCTRTRIIDSTIRSGPDLEYYRKWNFDVFIQPHLTNTADLNTKGRIQLDVGGNVHYRFDKNFGLSSGIHYQRISYAYALANDTSIDRLRFLRFPLVLSVYPVKRVQLSLGGSYHLALKASGQPRSHRTKFLSVENLCQQLGCDCAARYRLWRKFSASISYRFQKRNYNPIQRETQDFSGFALGIHYTILNPNRPK